MNYLDPFDPLHTDYEPLPLNPTPEQLKAYHQQTMRNLRYSLIVFVAMLFAMGVISLFTSCATTSESSYVERHRMETLFDRMDSLVSQRTVIQHDSAWRELIMRQFESIREKSDTSHTMVVDTAGRVIKETLIINNVRETDRETDRREIREMSHRLEVMDSTVSLMSLQVLHLDSLLQDRRESTVKTVSSPLSWWQRFRIWLGNIVLAAVAVLAAVWLVRKKIK